MLNSLPNKRKPEAWDIIGYPIVLAVALAIILGFFLIRVVPILSGIYNELHIIPPLSLRLAMALSNAATSPITWVVFAVALGGLYALYVRCVRRRFSAIEGRERLLALLLFTLTSSVVGAVVATFYSSAEYIIPYLR